MLKIAYVDFWRENSNILSFAPKYQNVQLIVTILARKLTLFERNVLTIFAPKKNQKNQKNSLCQKIKKKILKN